MFAVIQDGLLNYRGKTFETPVNIITVFFLVFIIFNDPGSMFLDRQPEEMIFAVAAIPFQ